MKKNLLSLSALFFLGCNQGTISTTNGGVAAANKAADGTASNGTPGEQAGTGTTNVSKLPIGKTAGLKTVLNCVPVSITKFPSSEEMQVLANQLGANAEFKANIVNASGYPHVRVLPPVSKSGEVVRVAWRPHIENCNRYRKWPTTCDLDIPMCAKYTGSHVFDAFGGVSSIPITSLPEGQLLGLEIVSLATGKLLYWRRATDTTTLLPDFIDGDPMISNLFKAKPSVADQTILGWADTAKLSTNGLSEPQFKALPACSKEKNNNFSQDYVFVSVWQIKPDVAKDKQIVNSVAGGDESVTGVSSASYTILQGVNDNRADSCY